MYTRARGRAGGRGGGARKGGTGRGPNVKSDLLDAFGLEDLLAVNSHPALISARMPGRLEKITLAYTTYLTKAHKPRVSLRSPVVRLYRRGVGGGANCRTALGSKRRARLRHRRANERQRTAPRDAAPVARTRPTHESSSDGRLLQLRHPYKLPLTRPALRRSSRQDARERRRGGHHRRL